MTFNDDASLDTSQVSDQRGGLGGIPGGGFTVGGGGLGIVGLVLYLIFGALGGGGDGAGNQLAPGQSGQVSARELASECRTGRDANERTDCRIVGYVNSVQSYWRSAVRGYQAADTVLFTGGVQTRCGSATSAVGPFYCPGDAQVYLDLSFFEELSSRLGGSSGRFAQAYVVAHEYGHHVQHLTGSDRRAAQGGQEGADSGSVRLELQADCYSGVWAHNAERTTDSQGRRLLDISDQDIQDGLQTAAAIGDDRLQQRSQGRVDPESWTHGSSEQRQRWFRTGYESGDPSSCDTFGGAI